MTEYKRIRIMAGIIMNICSKITSSRLAYICIYVCARLQNQSIIHLHNNLVTPEMILVADFFCTAQTNKQTNKHTFYYRYRIDTSIDATLPIDELMMLSCVSFFLFDFISYFFALFKTWLEVCWNRLEIECDKRGIWRERLFVSPT